MQIGDEYFGKPKQLLEILKRIRCRHRIQNWNSQRLQFYFNKGKSQYLKYKVVILKCQVIQFWELSANIDIKGWSVSLINQGTIHEYSHIQNSGYDGYNAFLSLVVGLTNTNQMKHDPCSRITITNTRKEAYAKVY